MWENLVPAELGLFFSKNDVHDPRLGEIVKRAVPETIDALLETADVAIIGAPDDRGIIANMGREGARLGPRAIRKSFYRLTPGFKPFLTELVMVDLGDIRTQGLSLKEVHEALKEVVAEVIRRGVFPIVLGGGHDLAYPDLCGLVDGLSLKEGDLGVINVDSHLDVREMEHGITSGTAFYRALTELPSKALRGENFVEYAVQELHNSPYYYNWLLERHCEILTLKTVQGRPIETFLQALQTAGEGTRCTAVSIDIDVARSTDAPGASASNPNGLSAQDLDKIAQLVGRESRVKLMDILEMSPPYDEGGRTAALCASVMFWFLKGLCDRR